MVRVPLSLLPVVAAGSAAGAVLRFALSLLSGSGFPWAVFAVNGLGSFLIGAYAGIAAASGLAAGPRWRAFVATGFCGGFTTFSVFSLEALSLLQAAPGKAGAFVCGSAALWLVAVAAGQQSGRWLASRRQVRRP